MLTNGAPGYPGVPGSAIGEIGAPSGLQLTWDGHRLGLFGNEQLMPTANGGAAPGTATGSRRPAARSASPPARSG